MSTSSVLDNAGFPTSVASAVSQFAVVATPHSSLVWAGSFPNANQNLVAVDLAVFEVRSEFGLLLDIVTNDTPPNALQLALKRQYAPSGTITNAASFQSGERFLATIPNFANATLRYQVPDRLFPIARYLYLWLDLPAVDPGATLTIDTKLIIL